MVITDISRGIGPEDGTLRLLRIWDTVSVDVGGEGAVQPRYYQIEISKN